MNRIIATGILLLTFAGAQAQEADHYIINSSLVHDINAGVTIFAFFLALILFVITLFRMRLDHRLKNKMIEKGVSDSLVEQFLKPATTDVKSISVKWFLLLAGVSLGSYLVYLSQPVGIHSIAIITFCMSLSFLAYYFFLKRNP